MERMRREDMNSDISNIPYEQYEKQFTGEEYEKLKVNRPKTLYAASRIPGIRPSTLLYLHYLRKKTQQA